MNTCKIKIFTLVLFVCGFMGIPHSGAFAHPYGTSFALSQSKLEPQAVVRPMAYNFGDIIQDSVVTTYFVITNEGSALLKIKNVWASCGCTAVMPAKNELKPGESTDLKVTFDSKGKSGKQNKTVYIETNDPKNSTITLALTGNIVEKEKSVFAQDSTHGKHLHKHDTVIKQDTTIVREGEIDLMAIDKNKDGKVFQDTMDWNVISDEPGECPLCGMKLKEVTLETAKKNLIENGFKVKE